LATAQRIWIQKRPAPALSPNHIVKTDSRRNTIEALSRRIEQTNLFGPNRRDPVPREVAANLPGLFDFSSLRAGIAMLLMRFFAVNAQAGAVYAQLR